MSTAAFQIGEQIDRYLILGEAGRGAMGKIYQARDVILGRVVALKVLPEEYSGRHEYRERFVREARAAAKIRHRNVVAVHDVHVHASDPLYIVMEFLEGETFDVFLKREAPVAFDRALEVLLPVMSAVIAAHENRVIHRDLKPANIMLCRERDGTHTPKVLDFGISKLTSTAALGRSSAATDLNLTSDDQQLGTPNYMAPEQDGDHHLVGPWSDGYSIAQMLYLCLTGHRAFVGSSVQEVIAAKRRGVFPAPSSFPFGLPPGLDAWMSRAMHADTTQRFQTLREAALALLALSPPASQTRWLPEFSPDDLVVDVGKTEAREAATSPVPKVLDDVADETARIRAMLPSDFSRVPKGVEPFLALRNRTSRRERVLVGALVFLLTTVIVLAIREVRRSDSAQRFSPEKSTEIPRTTLSPGPPTVQPTLPQVAVVSPVTPRVDASVATAPTPSKITHRVRQPSTPRHRGCLGTEYWTGTSCVRVFGANP
jgi:eukaryotic-like serine/threonine-protein kinase